MEQNTDKSDPSQEQNQAPQEAKASAGHAFRRYFVTGLATIFPVAVTIWVVVRILHFADQLLGKHLPYEIPGLGLVVTILLIVLVGFASIHLFGRFVLQVIEAWLTRLPFVKKIYPPVKQLTQFLFTTDGRTKAFQKTVLVEYPKDGVYTIGFVTNESITDILGTEQCLLTLLIPQPPSPFTGPIILVPKEKVIPLNLTIEDAIKLVVSAGVVSTPFQQQKNISERRV